MKPIRNIIWNPQTGWVVIFTDNTTFDITGNRTNPTWLEFDVALLEVLEDKKIEEPGPTGGPDDVGNIVSAALDIMEKNSPALMNIIAGALVEGAKPASSGTETAEFVEEIKALRSSIKEVQDRISRARYPDAPFDIQPTESDERLLASLQRQLDTRLGEEPTLDKPEYVTDDRGQEWVRTSSGGAWQPVVEEAGPRSLDELLFQFIETGEPIDKDTIDRILYVDKLRDWLDRRTITPEEAFNLAAPLMQNPQHLSEMMTALLSETGQDIPFFEFDAGIRANAPSTQDPTGPGAEAVYPGVGDEVNGLEAALTGPGDPVDLLEQQRREEFRAAEEATYRRSIGGQGFTTPDLTEGGAGPNILEAVQAAMSAPGFASMTEDVQIAEIRVAVAGIRYPGVDPIEAYLMGERDGTNPSREEIIRLAHQSRAASQGRPAPTVPGGRGVSGPVSDISTTQGPLTMLPSGQLTGAYDPELAYRAGMRSEVQENRLQQLIFQSEESAKRGKGMPPGVKQEIESLSARAAFRPGRAQFAGVGMGAEGTPALGFGGQLPAYGGTPFYPITPGQSPQGTFQALGVRGWNKRQQELFKARSPKRTVFG